jgi:hypothetical protein
MAAARRMRALEKMQRGTFSNVGERLSWSYYDTATLAVATTIFKLFTVPLGTGGKTLDLTNFTGNGALPQGQHMTIRGFRVMYRSITTTNTAGALAIGTTLDNTTLEFGIQNKAPMYQATLAEMFGIPISVQTTPTVAGDAMVLASRGIFNGYVPLGMPIVLAALTPFNFTLTHTAATAAGQAGDHIRVSLVGTLLRTT